MNTQGAILFLINFVIDLYIFLVLTRFILQAVRADFYNPVSQFVVKATNPVLLPLRRIVPGYGGIDVASLVVALLLVLVKILMVVVLAGANVEISAPALLLFGVREIGSLLLAYIFWAVLLRVILSWVSPDPYNPVNQIVTQVTEPVMAPARKLLPPMGGLDLSPIIVLLGVQFLRILFGL